jgi:beta-glucosidase
MFDPPDRVPYADIPFSVNDSEGHRALALETTRKSMVLLKNEGGLLPLSKELGTIAVIGPNADEVEVLLGNYNGIPSDPVSPLRGIREKVSTGTQVLHAVGSPLAEGLPPLEPIPTSVLRPAGGGSSTSSGGPAPAGVDPAAANQSSLGGGVASNAGELQAQPGRGLRAEYFANPDLEGNPFAIRVDEAVDFRWWGGIPMAGLEPGGFSVRWTGTLHPPETGTYSVGGKGLGQFQVFLGDSLVAGFSSEHEINTRWTDFQLEAGESLEIRVEYRPRRTDGAVQLVWAPPESASDLRAEALEAAERADAVVMFLGLSPRLEGEEMRVAVPGFAGGDRVDIGLPAPQRELMEAVVATGKPAVLVLLNGSALALPWAAENVPAILEAWYPGQAAGTAIADVLFGDYNPAGRLPVTFYRSVDQLPPFDEYDMDGRTYRYFHGDPLFPFGHGLSYTTFAYEDLELPDAVAVGEAVTVRVRVENVGSVAGEEVVQLYVTDVDASVPVPIRSLQGVERIHLEPGETRIVSFTLTPRQLSLIDDEWERVVDAGIFEVSVGGKQPGFTGVGDAGTTGVVKGRFEVLQGAASGR